MCHSRGRDEAEVSAALAAFAAALNEPHASRMVYVVAEPGNATIVDRGGEA